MSALHALHAMAHHVHSAMVFDHAVCDKRLAHCAADSCCGPGKLYGGRELPVCLRGTSATSEQTFLRLIWFCRTIVLGCQQYHPCRHCPHELPLKTPPAASAATFFAGREVAGGSHRYTEVEELFKKLHQRLADALEDVQQGNGGSNGTVATNSQARSSRGGSSNSSSSHRKFGDEDDEWGYDAGNRSPTYQAGIRQRRGNAAGCEPSQFGLLEMLLDCRGALDRAGSSQAAAGAAVEQNGSSRGGQAGQWQWGDGRAGTSGAGASRKREWWQR